MSDNTNEKWKVSVVDPKILLGGIMKKYMIIFMFFCLLNPLSVFAESIEVQLEKCVDGDTAKFKYADGTVMPYRFLAIDTPESVHPTKEVEAFGKEASEYTCNVLTNASKIVLELDDAADKLDRYGRGLAWIFVDDILLQEQLVSLGYAKVAYLYDNYKYTKQIQEKELLAKEQKLGIWSEEDSNWQEETKKSQKKASKNKSKNFLEDLIDSILESIVASINQIIDSILQSIEDML